MRLYFDTDCVAKCYLNEPGGLAVRRLARRASGLYSSMLAVAELSCVFHRQVREGRLGEDQAAAWRGHFLEDLAGDALHLVTALEASFPEVWSNDRHLPGAAEHFGLRGRSV
ncbi:MAG: type II toxin-antitoxin system VapC family toxin [Acidobacteria bacterium]|nr:type II toxin-antitoxin system VapC family toxin [Acidobacteriota bacterium]